MPQFHIPLSQSFEGSLKKYHAHRVLAYALEARGIWHSVKTEGNLFLKAAKNHLSCKFYGLKALRASNMFI